MIVAMWYNQLVVSEVFGKISEAVEVLQRLLGFKSSWLGFRGGWKDLRGRWENLRGS